RQNGGTRLPGPDRRGLRDRESLTVWRDPVPAMHVMTHQCHSDRQTGGLAEEILGGRGARPERDSVPGGIQSLGQWHSNRPTPSPASAWPLWVIHFRLLAPAQTGL